MDDSKDPRLMDFGLPPEEPEIECTCSYKNDPFKAPEQHAWDCPVRQHVEQLMDEDARYRPCFMDGDGSCECFRADDTYKGTPVYYSRPICKMRAEGQNVPDEVTVEPGAQHIPPGYTVCEDCASVLRSVVVDAIEGNPTGIVAVDMPNLIEHALQVRDALRLGRVQNGIALMDALCLKLGVEE